MNFILFENITSSKIGIVDVIDPSSLKLDCPKPMGAIIGQNGNNIFWIGIVTFISATFVLKGNKNAIFFAAISGGLGYLGYLLFLDLGGFVNFVLGTGMTIISSLEIVTSFTAYFKNKSIRT